MFLAKMLEKYELDVVSVESAEQAIEYLGHHRPDVIFMDHLMPGMDGFQAVQTIKNNPRTATIPIMMYTSQEGELYVGQARALGAVGVLPKQIKPADVSKVLYQLHLLPDRRTSEQSTFLEIEDADPNGSEGYHASTAARQPNGAARPVTEAMLREQIGELRRSFGERVARDHTRFFRDRCVQPAARRTPEAQRDVDRGRRGARRNHRGREPRHSGPAGGTHRGACRPSRRAAHLTHRFPARAQRCGSR